MQAIRNRAMYEQVMAPVRQWLIDNPTASARAAAVRFNIPASLITSKFRDEFDFTHRRSLRGQANKPKPKKPLLVVASDETAALMAMMQKVREEVRAVRMVVQEVSVVMGFLMVELGYKKDAQATLTEGK